MLIVDVLTETAADETYHFTPIECGNLYFGETKPHQSYWKPVRFLQYNN